MVQSYTVWTVFSLDQDPYSFWVGATDEGREGDWFWTGSLEPVSDFVWYPGQPEDLTYENCMVWRAAHLLGADYECDNHAFPACQIIV